MIHIINLLAGWIIRMIRIYIWRHCIAEWVPHHLRRTATLNLAIKLICLSCRTFMNLHLLILWHMHLLRLHHSHGLRSLAIHIEILMINVRNLLWILSWLSHHLNVTLIVSWTLMPLKLSMEAIHHVLLLRLWLLLRLCILTSEVNMDRKVILWAWLRYILWWKGCIFKCCIVRMWVKSQLIIPWRLHMTWVTVLIVLAHRLLMWDRHIFSICLFRVHLIFVHKLVIS